MSNPTGSGSEGQAHLPQSRNENVSRELRKLREAWPASSDVRVEISFEVDGQKHAGTLIEFSERGAKLAAELRPHVGSKIKVGRVVARVVDWFDGGIGIEFLDVAD